MNFGCCLLMKRADGEADESAVLLRQLEEGIAAAAEAGFDFIELPSWAVSRLAPGETERAKRLLAESGLRAPVFNSIVPPGAMLAGPDADPEALDAHLKETMRAVRDFGGEVAVFGGAKQRFAPKGFARDAALEQIERFVQLCERHAADNGIVVAVEHISRKETNMVRTLEEATELAAKQYSPHVKALADSYHMFIEREEFDSLTEAVDMDLLAHVHLADRDRKFPGEAAGPEAGGEVEEAAPGVDFAALIGALRDSGYEGRLSLECLYADWNELRVKGKASLALLRSL
ncbi:sugar phosphate isomerase/epimerase family protein [Paenibacillus sp. MBLB4367]|uniref:sugar phosphate isomerase/epimerase family protein n=1 Tax=Paenibacillus sp. MBLB4367 TaxID=3384767 RepID=UPI0039082AB0